MKVIQVVWGACADHLVDEWFETVKDLEEVGFSTSTQFQKLRLEHKKGNIFIEDVTTYKGQVLEINKFAVVKDWPSDFLCEGEYLSAKILGWYVDE